jgi:hypothetical protein
MRRGGGVGEERRREGAVGFDTRTGAERDAGRDAGASASESRRWGAELRGVRGEKR